MWDEATGMVGNAVVERSKLRFAFHESSTCVSTTTDPNPPSATHALKFVREPYRDHRGTDVRMRTFDSFDRDLLYGVRPWAGRAVEHARGWVRSAKVFQFVVVARPNTHRSVTSNFCARRRRGRWLAPLPVLADSPASRLPNQSSGRLPKGSMICLVILPVLISRSLAACYSTGTGSQRRKEERDSMIDLPVQLPHTL
jgi:hypothetical protein